MGCVAWCTTLPVSGFTIAISSGSNTITTACPAGSKDIGCHIDTTGLFAEAWRRAFPLSNMQSCECYDYFGSKCVASCATNIQNYEIQSVWGSGNVIISCSNPANSVLGCGSNPNGASTKEQFRYTKVNNQNSCVCYDAFGTRCYAICGKIVY